MASTEPLSQDYYFSNPDDPDFTGGTLEYAIKMAKTWNVNIMLYDEAGFRVGRVSADGNYILQ